MAFSVIIPARYDSTRLPGKPLLDLDGVSMIERVYRQAEKSDAARVCVATDDERIAAHVAGFSGEHVMTDRDHPSGTDRVHQAATLMGLAKDDVVVNVQGDEPLMPPEAINQVAAAIADGCEMATLCEPIQDLAQVNDPNVVKVVRSIEDNALYFSRAPIPFDRDQAGDHFAYRHLGIYAYTVNLLSRFVAWPASSLEQIEKLEQLRVLENNHTIKVHISEVSIPPGIDVEEDVELVINQIRGKHE